MRRIEKQEPGGPGSPGAESAAPPEEKTGRWIWPLATMGLAIWAKVLDALL